MRLRDAWSWAITAALALACGFVGALAADHAPLLQPRPASQEDRASFSEKVDLLLSQHMSLTADQHRRLEQIDHNYTIDCNLILADLHASNAELGAALSDDMSMSAGARQAISEIQGNVGQMQTATVQYILDVRMVLTPAQRKIFDGRIVADLL